MREPAVAAEDKLEAADRKHTVLLDFVAVIAYRYESLKRAAVGQRIVVAY